MAAVVYADHLVREEGNDVVAALQGFLNQLSGFLIIKSADEPIMPLDRMRSPLPFRPRRETMLLSRLVGNCAHCEQERFTSRCVPECLKAKVDEGRRLVCSPSIDRPAVLTIGIFAEQMVCRVKNGQHRTSSKISGGRTPRSATSPVVGEQHEKSRVGPVRCNGSFAATGNQRCNE